MAPLSYGLGAIANSDDMIWYDTCTSTTWHIRTFYISSICCQT